MEPAAVEALHLRRLIEQQPACLLRVGIDGLLLAVNGAALRLFGGETLAQVLGTKLTKLIMPRQHEEWEEFAARIRDGASASIECDLIDLSGTRRSILLQGVPLLDHADGVPSMILTARDISAPRRLEAALRERESGRELDDLQKELQQGFSDLSRSEALTDRQIDLQPPIASPIVDAAELEQLRQTLTQEHETALLLKERAAQQLIDSARTALDQAVAEQQRLTTLLDDRQIGHERVVAAHAAERARLQQTLTEEHQAVLLLKEREGQQLLDGLRTELQQARAEQQRLTAIADEREVHHQRATAAQAVELRHVQQTLAEEHQLALLLKDREAQELLDGVRTDLEQARAEQQRLTTLVEDRELGHQRALSAQAAGHALSHAQTRQALTEEHRRALLLKEREGQQLADRVRSELEQALAGRQRLAAMLDEREIGHQQIDAEHAATRAGMQQALAAAILKQTEMQKALADQRVELQTVEENARGLELLAAAGRVALAVGREMQTVVAALDARTQHLLVESALDAGNRHVIEALRVDAIEASSLARQILQIQAETPLPGDSSKAGRKA
jgi:PAS domain S-box-containing protein